jgi:hypothetical protein
LTKKKDPSAAYMMPLLNTYYIYDGTSNLDQQFANREQTGHAIILQLLQPHFIFFPNDVPLSDYVMDELINDEEAEQEDDMQYLYECNEPHDRQKRLSGEPTLPAIATPSRRASSRHGKSDKVIPTNSTDGLSIHIGPKKCFSAKKKYKKLKIVLLNCIYRGVQ